MAGPGDSIKVALALDASDLAAQVKAALREVVSEIGGAVGSLAGKAAREAAGAAKGAGNLSRIIRLQSGIGEYQRQFRPKKPIDVGIIPSADAPGYEFTQAEVLLKEARSASADWRKSRHAATRSRLALRNVERMAKAYGLEFDPSAIKERIGALRRASRADNEAAAAEERFNIDNMIREARANLAEQLRGARQEATEKRRAESMKYRARGAELSLGRRAKKLRQLGAQLPEEYERFLETAASARKGAPVDPHEFGIQRKAAELAISDAAEAARAEAARDRQSTRAEQRLQAERARQEKEAGRAKEYAERVLKRTSVMQARAAAAGIEAPESLRSVIDLAKRAASGEAITTQQLRAAYETAGTDIQLSRLAKSKRAKPEAKAAVKDPEEARREAYALDVSLRKKLLKLSRSEIDKDKAKELRSKGEEVAGLIKAGKIADAKIALRDLSVSIETFADTTKKSAKVSKDAQRQAGAGGGLRGSMMPYLGGPTIAGMFSASLRSPEFLPVALGGLLLRSASWRSARLGSIIGRNFGGPTPSVAGAGPGAPGSAGGGLAEQLRGAIAMTMRGISDRAGVAYLYAKDSIASIPRYLGGAVRGIGDRAGVAYLYAKDAIAGIPGYLGGAIRKINDALATRAIRRSLGMEEGQQRRSYLSSIRGIPGRISDAFTSASIRAYVSAGTAMHYIRSKFARSRVAPTAAPQDAPQDAPAMVAAALGGKPPLLPPPPGGGGGGPAAPKGGGGGGGGSAGSMAATAGGARFLGMGVLPAIAAVGAVAMVSHGLQKIDEANALKDQVFPTLGLFRRGKGTGSFRGDELAIQKFGERMFAAMASRGVGMGPREAAAFMGEVGGSAFNPMSVFGSEFGIYAAARESRSLGLSRGAVAGIGSLMARGVLANKRVGRGAFAAFTGGPADYMRSIAMAAQATGIAPDIMAQTSLGLAEHLASAGIYGDGTLAGINRAFTGIGQAGVGFHGARQAVSGIYGDIASTRQLLTSPFSGLGKIAALQSAISRAPAGDIAGLISAAESTTAKDVARGLQLFGPEAAKLYTMGLGVGSSDAFKVQQGLLGKPTDMELQRLPVAATPYASAMAESFAFERAERESLRESMAKLKEVVDDLADSLASALREVGGAFL